MGKTGMGELLKTRMAAARSASELQLGDEAYEKIFQGPVPPSRAKICELPLEKLLPFFTADIGFKPYPQAKLAAFAQQIDEEGLYERIIVRPIPGRDRYEILAGHNRTGAARLNGWAAIPAEIVEADDARATSIAIATNLLRRQELTVIERGKAYKALLSAKNRNGQHNPYGNDETFGESRQRYNARAIVADFFGVTEYEIRKAIKLTQLIPPLADILENDPKRLNLACADLIADYDAATQEAFVELCRIEGYCLNKAAVKHILATCPAPSAERHQILNAWREGRAMEERRKMAPPRKISFDRKRFAPYLDKLGGEKELEEQFLEFLRERVKLAHPA